MTAHRAWLTIVATTALLAISNVAAAQQRVADERWVATWGTALTLFQAAPAIPRAAQGQPAPTPPQQSAPAPVSTSPAATSPAAAAPSNGPARRFGIPTPLDSLRDQTLRMVVRTSLGGRRVRVRLYNAIGGRAVWVGAAHVAVSAGGSGIVPASGRALSFGGRPAVTLYAGQTVVSDPVSLEVQPLTDLAVSLYFPEETGPPTSHRFALRHGYVSTSGDVTAAREIADTVRTTESYHWLAGIDVLAPASAGVVVNFGDSITDGDQSTPDSSRAWPTLLARRLQQNRATRHIGVVNAGVSGNRLLGDNGSGLVRFVKDALSVPGVRWVTVLEGINDITGGTRDPSAPTLTADDLIAAYRQVIELAHVQGVRVIGCTITPYGGSRVHNAVGEAIRQRVNQWIRTSGAFDAVVDFDAATRDPANPTRFRAEADSPDLLHPGDAGYRLMAEAIDLALFTRAQVVR
ncbi:MAG TPA: SGNH/GDSL hydrolase family protein [Gemmatimonadaceae bacterium]|nr:SGNH/GDSL hydrolase family protein [Gemmatimonadaceae bacterium]